MFQGSGDKGDKAIRVDDQPENGRNAADKGRFILSKQTQVEFGLQETDIPDNMKQVLPVNTHYTDFVSRNVRIPSFQNNMNKIGYMNKIKTGIEQQADARTRVERAQSKKQKHLVIRAAKWDDFRLRREKAIDKYIQAKKEQRSAELMLKVAALVQYGVKGVITFIAREKREGTER